MHSSGYWTWFNACGLPVYCLYQKNAQCIILVIELDLMHVASPAIVCIKSINIDIAVPRVLCQTVTDVKENPG